jgi:hypothetical protein
MQKIKSIITLLTPPISFMFKNENNKINPIYNDENNVHWQIVITNNTNTPFEIKNIFICPFDKGEKQMQPTTRTIDAPLESHQSTIYNYDPGKIPDLTRGKRIDEQIIACIFSYSGDEYYSNGIRQRLYNLYKRIKHRIKF